MARLPRPCATPGCPRLIREGSRCQEHERAADRKRGSPASRGYDAAHQAWREEVLARDPVCRMCGAAPSTVADHVVPLRRGGTWDLSNGQGLCHGCHNAKTARER